MLLQKEESIGKGSILKKSFSMVELIFAIIIVALAIGALPSVVRSVDESTAYSINQESIWLASGLMFDIMDYQWDENNYDNSKRKAIDVSSEGDSNFNRNPSAGYRRVGHIFADERRSFFNIPTGSPTPTASPVLGQDGGDLDDIDDFINSTSVNTRGTINVALTEYKKNYSSKVEVFYIEDSAKDSSGNTVDGQYNTSSRHINFKLTNSSPISSGSTNIKFIKVKMYDCDDNELLTLSAFSCNIGEYLDLMNKVN